MEQHSYLTIKQFSQKHAAFPESTLRWLRFNSEKNGLENSFKKLGRRVLINETEFFKSIEDLQGGGAS